MPRSAATARLQLARKLYHDVEATRVGGARKGPCERHLHFGRRGNRTWMLHRCRRWHNLLINFMPGGGWGWIPPIGAFHTHFRGFSGRIIRRQGKTSRIMDRTQTIVASTSAGND